LSQRNRDRDLHEQRRGNMRVSFAVCRPGGSPASNKPTL
jgi:hypothetical protein